MEAEKTVTYLLAFQLQNHSIGLVLRGRALVRRSTPEEQQVTHSGRTIDGEAVHEVKKAAWHTTEDKSQKSAGYDE